MPQYFSPGVYVEEVDSGPRPIAGVSTSVAGAVGVTERGPVDKPVLITSFKEYRDVFGSYLGELDAKDFNENQWRLFPNAVEGFFANGGTQIYVQRVLDQNTAEKASLTRQEADDDEDEPVGDGGAGDGGAGDGGAGDGGAGDGGAGDGGAADTKPVLGLALASVGTWGKRVAVKIEPTDKTKKVVSLTIELQDEDGNSLFEEVLSDVKFVSTNPADPQLWQNAINRGSQLLSASAVEENEFPSDTVTLKGTGGNDGLSTLSSSQFKTGIEKLEEVDDISIVMAPGVSDDSVVQELLAHCKEMRYRVAIIDPPSNSTNASVVTFRDKFDSNYAALYYPWVNVVQPRKVNPVLCPPSGHMAGIYADVDSRRGVHKAPANEIIQGITEISSVITKRHQDLLNPKGINALRFFPGRGNRVWGGRTISSDTNFRYINVRRIFNFIERSIDEGTQWVVFEPNNAELWSRVRQSVSNFLNTQWRAGALEGAKPDDAYFVACDRGSTMTQDDIENGRLIVEVGIAPVYPAEFVIFRVQKYVSASKLA